MYKIILDKKVIDVVRIPRFIRFLSSGHIALTDKSSAQGIVGSDDRTVYSFKPISKEDILVVEIEEITLEELNKLQGLLSSGQEPCVNEETFVTIKKEVIKRLSILCKNKITEGFSIILSDGKIYNFKLTTEDQLNLISIDGQLQAGAKTFVYHATDQPCQVFLRDDMTKIINMFKQHILYHTTYFNVAKQYINLAQDLKTVSNFVYGDDVSSIVTDTTIKQILKNGGNLT